MNNELIEEKNNSLTMNSGRTNDAVVAAEIAKVQAQCVLAYQNPRKMLNVENKINSICESLYLAKEAEYEYTRGGQKVTGPTIKLMSAIAQCYGNVTSGWKEISRTKDKAKVLAWAWDIENNYKYDLEFEVSFYRETKKDGKTLLTSDRDIYEIIANNAARRVRKCIESVIPRYLIDMALEKCQKTISSKVDVKSELKKCINWLKSYQDVNLEQIEDKLGMKYDAFGNVQYSTIAKWINALRDGTTKKEDIFPDKDREYKNLADVNAKQYQDVASKELPSEIKPDKQEEPKQETKQTAPTTQIQPETIDRSQLIDELLKGH